MSTAVLRWRITAVFVVFEAGMPLAGLAAGAPLARTIGTTAGYVAGAVLLAVGAWMLLAGDDDEGKAAGLATSCGLALLSLGVQVSLDELAVGFSLGLVRLPRPGGDRRNRPLALIAAQAGLLLGGRLSERLPEKVERAAGPGAGPCSAST